MANVRESVPRVSKKKIYINSLFMNPMVEWGSLYGAALDLGVLV